MSILISVNQIAPVAPPEDRLRDGHGRAITDLRVSVTDLCNYRCVYCCEGKLDTHYGKLSHDDYLRAIRIFVDLGIEKVRITGGNLCFDATLWI